MSALRSVEMNLAPESLNIFFPLFQQGVEIEVEVGCTIKQLLVEQLGISADYLANRITTLFLNSKAIDDAATAVLQDNAVLALSGAMPGLVGATMRSGGHLAAMRGAMTYSNDAGDIGAKPGRIKLKLFNLLLEELGPMLLSRGILMTGSRFQGLLLEQPKDLRPRDCRIDGRSVTADQLPLLFDLGNEGHLVRLKATFGE